MHNKHVVEYGYGNIAILALFWSNEEVVMSLEANAFKVSPSVYQRQL